MLGDYEDYGIGYKLAISFILEKHPDITDSPDVKFEEWAETILFACNAAEQLEFDDSVNIILGQQILYYTVIMLLELTLPL